LPRQIGSARRI